MRPRSASRGWYWKQKVHTIINSIQSVTLHFYSSRRHCLGMHPPLFCCYVVVVVVVQTLAFSLFRVLRVLACVCMRVYMCPLGFWVARVCVYMLACVNTPLFLQQRCSDAVSVEHFFLAAVFKKHRFFLFFLFLVMCYSNYRLLLLMTRLLKCLWHRYCDWSGAYIVGRWKPCVLCSFNDPDYNVPIWSTKQIQWIHSVIYK